MKTSNPSIKSKPKAIILLSGGLDSTLAAHLVEKQGLELTALNFTSPFCMCNKKGGCSQGVSSVASKLGINLVKIDNTEEMLECVKKPKFGYGSNMNPCIDCRIVMLKKAKNYMLSNGASFIITGEVLGQRPMSQRRPILTLIEKEAGLEGLILRPLSAKVLDETIPEKQGLINRNELLNISGRGRKEQIELAKKFSVNDYPCPAGGCLLTDPNFARRLKDLMRYAPDFVLNDCLLLKSGRHMRINPEAKLVIGRNEAENNSLINLSLDSDLIFMPQESIAGPTALGRGNFSADDLRLAASLVAFYCDKDEDQEIGIILKNKAARGDIEFKIKPADQELLDKLIL